MNEEDEIRSLLVRRTDAVRNHDAAGANAMLDPHIVAFEMAGPLQVPSAQASDNALTQAWLDSFEEGPHVTLEELSIYADGTVAFCHSLNRLQGRRADGQQIELTMRSTLGLRKSEGEWKIVHGHTSLPR